MSEQTQEPDDGLEFDPLAYEPFGSEVYGTENTEESHSPYDDEHQVSDPDGREEDGLDDSLGPLTLRTGNSAAQWAMAQHSGWSNYCLVFTRTAFQVPAYYGTAARAYESAQHKHPVTSGSQVPRGVPCFWTGGSHGYGHITVSLGGGLCRSTDWPHRNQINTVAIDQIHRSWGLHLAGWTEDLNRVRIWTPPKVSSVDGVVSLANLRPGKNNKDVLEMQRRLVKRNMATYTPTGHYGAKTKESVKKWQVRCGFRGADADGLAGRISMQRLGLAVH